MNQIILILKAIIPTMEHFIKLVDIVIWPCIILISVFKLREPIKSLLPLIENVKYKGIEVKFRKELDSIKEEAEEAGIKLQTEIAESTNIYKLIEISPSVAIIQAWKELEISARKKVKELAPKDSKFKDINNRAISYLEYTGALQPSTAKAIRELKLLRNKVSHSSNVDITKEDAVEYASLSKAISNQIDSIQELPKFKLVHLTRIIAELNSLIDSGKYNHISITDIHPIIEQKRIIPYLIETTKGDADFSVYGVDSPYENFIKHYHEHMYQIYSGYAGDERRKWGIENLGLSLLLAWTNEIAQQGTGWYPSQH